MQVAIYARVSTERQEREQTIDSQLAVLRTWAVEHGHTLEPEHVYADEGYSGSRLDRPGLDRLRDAAREAEFVAVAVLSPDRLARRYAYQVLLIEELRRVGCQVVFLLHPISEDPNDQLLLQIQGAVAEYERAVLGERFRRGRLQRARAGQYLAGGHAPYGYRYIRKREGLPGHLVIDEAEAEVVRALYQWLVDEQLSLRQILGRLNFGSWRPRSGSRRWSSSLVHHILSDPIYTGIAYANRYRAVPPKKPRGPHGPRTSERCSHALRPRDEWIPVPVPAILDQATYARAQEQLARNAKLSFRHNTRYRYLLRCLLTCGTCGLAMSGKTYPATATQPERRYYTCNGKDRLLSARDRPCPRRPVKADELEAVVWEHLTALLQDPARLLAQFEAAVQAGREGDAREQAEQRRITARLERLGRQDARLVDAYQAEVITLEELAERRASLAQQRRILTEQYEQWERFRQQQVRAQETLSSLSRFCERIRNRLAVVTFDEQQTILQLLIERIIVGDVTLEIRHVIPLDKPPGTDQPDVPPWRLRSDGSRGSQLVLR
jgi:site-specific DNA recombinase